MIDYTEIRKMLMEEFKDSSPTPTIEEINAFETALIWFEDALINADDTEYRLQDFIPVKRYNYYLKKALFAATGYVNTIDNLQKKIAEKDIELANVKDELSRREKDVNNLLNLPKATLNELRKENRYKIMNTEIEDLKKYRDIFAGMYFGLLQKQKK